MSIILRSGNSPDLASVNDAGEVLTYTRLSSTTDPVPIKNVLVAENSGDFGPGQTGLVGPFSTEGAGNCTWAVKNTTAAVPFTGTVVVEFEQSDDGESWAALPVMRSDTNVIASQHLLTDNVANRSIIFDSEVVGVRYARARVVAAPVSGSMRICANSGTAPFSPWVSIAEPARTAVVVSGVNLAVGVSGSEQLLSLTRVRAGVHTTATSFAVTAGKTFRATSLLLSQIGTSTFQASQTIFRLRYNLTGAISTTSPVILAARLATTATAGSYESIPLTLPDGFEMPGDGVAQMGITINSAWTSSSPTVDVLMVGYEY